MVPTWLVAGASLAYLGLLFAIAAWGDRRAEAGRSVIDSGVVYALSLAVYATSWTYYGSVGRATSTGVGFLPVYLGATVAVLLWPVVVRKIIQICRRDRITSLSDFVASRYGGSAGLGALVTLVAVVGTVPYIALQLKAVTVTVDLLRAPAVAAGGAAAPPAAVPLWQDTAFYAAVLLAAFTILFGTRHLDSAERHEGMVAAIAVESVVKVVALLAVGGWVVFAVFDGPADLFGQAAARPDLAPLLEFSAAGTPASWAWLTVLSMLAVLLLPRQWQVGVVENVDERHLATATWLFPLYLLLVNLPVLPVALAGLLVLGRDGADPDTFVLALPLAEAQPALALLVFLGGLSAATGMVVVETTALSTMVSNSVVMPLLLRLRGPLAARPAGLGGRGLAGTVLGVRRAAIVALLLLGYAYFRVAGEAIALVSIGLLSFAAAAQVAPALLGGLVWRGATRRGAVAGLAAGFAVWAYTLLLPYLARSGWLPLEVVTDGPFGVGLLAPQALFGLEGLDEISHAMLWSMIANVGLFVGLSVTGRRDPAEQLRAAAFVDGVGSARPGAEALLSPGRAGVADLRGLLERFLGPERAARALAEAAQSGVVVTPGAPADARLVRHVETQLAGVVGSTSARVAVASVTAAQPPGVDDVLEVLDETTQVLATARALERKSAELEAATTELRAANERLRELDRLKDEFVSTVTHELRTPLTSIRAFSEILLDNPDLDADERAGFLATVVDETARLTRLIDQVLDLSKLEAGRVEWRVEAVDLAEVAVASAQAVAQLARDRGVTLHLDLPDGAPVARADRDRVVQVLVNLLGNAVKFVEPGTGTVLARVRSGGGTGRVEVVDDGPGIPAEEQELVFDRFRQVRGSGGDRPAGTGLGLAISREIAERLGGRLEVTSEPGAGATFCLTLPLADPGGTATGGGGEDR